MCFLILLYFVCIRQVIWSSDKDDNDWMDSYRQGLVRGNPSNKRKHPYLVSVKFEKQDGIMCSGAILGKRWVITSITCAFVYDADELKIRAGSKYGDKGGQMIGVHLVLKHKKFDEGWKNDLALLLLEKEIKFGEYAQPIEISDEYPTVGTNATISGWSYLTDANYSSVFDDDYPIIDSGSCLEYFKEYFKGEKMPNIGSENFCTFKKGHSPCKCDDGDPLVYNGKLIGIFSETRNCMEGKVPAVYSTLANHTKWILDKLSIGAII